MGKVIYKKALLILLYIVLIVSLCAFKGKETTSQSLFPAMQRTKNGDFYGYINRQGKWIVEPIYDRVYPFSDERGIIVRENLSGVLDEDGQIVVEPMYLGLSPFKEERAIFVSSEGQGVINKQGVVLTHKTYPYISDYKEGLAIIEENQPDATFLYGYMDTNGKEVIKPIYKQANPFQEGKALVQGEDGKYSIINQKGKVLVTLDVANAYGYSEGKIIFSQGENGLWGYINDKGKVVIEPIYQRAEPFKEGVAIVGVSPYYWGEAGLISEKGEKIYPTEYNDILYLGEGRVALGQAIDKEEPIKGSVYAIADIKGNILTDFIYYGVSEYDEGVASAYDQENTYFINLEGEKIGTLSVVKGSGTLSEEEAIVIADIDYETKYLTKEGEIIYAPNIKIPLNATYGINVEKYKPNINYLVYEPQVEGMKDLGREKVVNEKLKKLSRGEEEGLNQPLDYSYYSNFNVQYYKDDLLVLKIMSSTYPFGAAHPMPTMDTPVINLVTGEFYKLDDIFNKEKNWKETLNAILQEMAKEEPLKGELFQDAKIEIGENQPFYVDDKALYIYYAPYEIGPYSSGFITFKIPYEKINAILSLKE